MQVAFYAPLKPPDHATPSGDRRMAQLLVAALETAGHRVELAARLQSRDPRGDPARQRRLAELGDRLAARYRRRVRRRPAAERPAVWLTYHLYYKAPDWIGPAAARGLGIPYVAAEASHAPKRAGGPWDPGHRQVEAALAQAAAVLTINPADAEGLPGALEQVALPPFLDRTPFAAATANRSALATSYGLDPGQPWLVAVGMFRDGAKRASYAELGTALGRLTGRSWQLLVVGDGPARGAVEAALAPLGRRVRYVGVLEPAALPSLLASADLCVWPAVDEAYGMALLEAQAAGCPVVAAEIGGVPAIVADGETGRLVPPHDPDAFAAAVAALLDDPDRRAALGRAAAAKVARAHTIDTAAQRVDALLRRVTGAA